MQARTRVQTQQPAPEVLPRMGPMKRDPALVRDLVDNAGGKVGLGDFRPDRKGPFGKFKIIHWTATKL